MHCRKRHVSTPSFRCVCFGLIVGLGTVLACTPSPGGVDGGSGGGSAGGGNAGGGTGGSGGGAATTDGGICAVQHEESLGGATLTVCDQAYADPPYVRPPADSTGSDPQHIYGGIAHGAGFVMGFTGRGFRADAPGNPEWMTAEASNGVQRYGDFVYLATVEAGAVQSLQPAIRIDDRVFATLLAGRAYEGLMSPRDPAAPTLSWDYQHHTVPVRIVLDAEPQMTVLDQIPGYPRYALLGHVENAKVAVRAADGGCLAALTSFGDTNPLGLATDAGDEIQLARQPNMHGNYDDVFTLIWPAGTVPNGGSNMGGGLFISTAALLQSVPPDLTNASSFPHGTPSDGPSADLSLVTGGGGTCN